MKVKYDSKYYIIEGEPYLSVAKAYMKEYQAAHKRICKYLDSLGIKQWRYGWGGQIAGVVIGKSKFAEFFTKPDRHGISFPKRKTEYNKEFDKEIYRLPSLATYVNKFTIPTGFSYSYEWCKGSCAVGHPLNPIEICWYKLGKDAPIMFKIPDIQTTIKRYKILYPDIVFENGVDEWKLDETGLREILVEEWDLMVAKHEKEQRK